MINATIIGRITKELNLRKVPINGTDTPVLNFTVAADDGFRKDKDGNKVDTEFFRVTAWRGAAESIAKYCGKGREIAVKGAVHLEYYTGKDGQKVAYLSIPRPEGFEFCGQKTVNEAPAEVELPWEEE